MPSSPRVIDVDKTDFPNAPVVYTIEREGVPLTVIKKIGH